MMRLSWIAKVMQTVGEDWSCPLGEEILQHWEYDPGSVFFFRASANFVCVFRKAGQRRFLRFNAVTERSLRSVGSEVNLVDWLDRHGVKVAAPIPSRSGRFVETVETSLGRFNAVVFTGLPGAQGELEDLEPTQFRTWGAALGRLHAAMRTYPSPSNRPTWRDQLEVARPFIPAGSTLEAEWARLMTWANSLPTDGDRFGLIHFDFELDNLYWQDQEIAILDFDDSVQSWYVADIAYALRDLFEDGVDPRNQLFQEFIAGYGEHHPIDGELLAQLPEFLKLHQLVLFGRLSRALDLPANQEVPEWLQKLNAKLQSRVDRYVASL